MRSAFAKRIERPSTPPAQDKPIARRTAGALLAILAVSCLYLAYLLISGTGDTGSLHLATVIPATSAGLCLLRAWAEPRERKMWIYWGGAMAVIAASVLVSDISDGSLPPQAAALRMCYYPFAAAGLIYMTSHRFYGKANVAPLDAAIGLLAMICVSTTALAGTVGPAFGQDPGRTVTDLLFPIGDTAMIALMVRAFTLSGFRSSLSGFLSFVQLMLFWGGDVARLIFNANNLWDQASLVTIVWSLGALAIGASSWVRVPAPRPRRPLNHRSFAPVIWSAAVGTVLAAGTFHTLPLPSLMLAALVMGILLLRMVRAFYYNEASVAEITDAGRTDALTGLSNRRALNERLAEAQAGQELVTLVMLDLNGFKGYNDTFGHPAGDALLQRLAEKFTSVLGHPEYAYRLGGDEFCCVLPADFPVTPEQIGRAFTDSGPKFEITAAYGSAQLGHEAPDAESLMRLADRRLYVHKDGGRRSAASEIAASLLQSLDERMGHSTHDCSAMAQALASRAGMEGDELQATVTAAKLRDIGLVVLPDSVRERRSGLTPEDEQLLRTSPIAAQRILSSAPATLAAGQLVRSARERWDGSGYPDGLAGEEIPLGSRVVALCGAWTALKHDRPSSRGLSDSEALTLLRGRKGYYDPVLTDLLEQVLAAKLVQHTTVASAGSSR